MRFGTVLLGAAIGGVYAATTKGDVMKSALWGAGIGGALTLIGGASVSLGRARVSVSGKDFFAGLDPSPNVVTPPAFQPPPFAYPSGPAPGPEYQPQMSMPAGYPWW
jgi:hypothetical protein